MLQTTVIEDAHWVDPTSLEVFGRTVDQIKTLPVLLIVTFAPSSTRLGPDGRNRHLGAEPACGTGAVAAIIAGIVGQHLAASQPAADRWRPAYSWKR